MSKVIDFFKNPHIQIALAAGVSIIALAWASKRMLPAPIGNLPTAFPPFLMVIYEGVLTKYKDSDHWIARPGPWIAAILLSTAVIVLWHMR